MLARLTSPFTFVLLAAQVASCTGAKEEQAAASAVGIDPSATGDPMLIGYYDAKQQKDFNINELNPANLTHVVLMNGVKVSIDGKLHTRPKKFPWEKSAEELIQIMGAQNKSFIVQIRGFPDDDTFDQVAENPETLKTFVSTLARRAYFWGASGVELEWHSDDVAGGKQLDAGFDEAEQGHFLTLCQELSKTLKARGLTLSVAVRPSRNEFAPDSRIQDYVDWLMVRAFSMRSLGDPHHSSVKDAKHALGEWLSRGVPASQLILGTPLFAKTGSALRREGHHNGPRIGWGQIRDKALVAKDPKGDTFVDEDTGKVWWASGPRTTEDKVKHVIKEGFGGVALRELHHDDRDPGLSLVNAAASVVQQHSDERAQLLLQLPGPGIGLFQKDLKPGRSEGRKRHMEEF